ncbi:endonuclease domain-containing protein [Falsiroseomonas sp. HW251]|uniref:endonuclease domain-containing protein n=1 Tax=Falsiroseomonas sp. HW251 TaxID=3390998 RepID=UPI003D320861
MLRDAARRLRRDSTHAERVLWRALRVNALGVPFRLQHPIANYVADFAAPSIMLVVEVDGGQHGGDDDVPRDAKLASLGWRVLRFWNNEVMENREGVLARIQDVVSDALNAGSSANPLPGPPPLAGEGSS